MSFHPVQPRAPKPGLTPGGRMPRSYEVRQALGVPTPEEVEPPDQHEDCVTCLRYDRAGEWLAVGTKGGGIKLLRERDSLLGEETSVTAFQTQVDPLNSLEIDSKVKDMCWLQRCNTTRLVLAANDKTIKLYRVAERKGRMGAGPDSNQFIGLPHGVFHKLRLPHFIPEPPTATCKVKRLFASDHEYAINSLSLASDGEYFLSSDDLVIHQWHAAHSTESLKLVSIKPECMDDLNETITTAAYHPRHCNLFTFSTSKGITHLCDLRENVICRQYASIFDASTCPPASHVDLFYATLLTGVSCLAYHPLDSRQFVTRDFLTLKLWDMAMPSQPTRVFPVQDHLLKDALPDLYETDIIFDRFEVAWTPDARHFITGTYRHEWVQIEADSGRAHHYQRHGGRCAAPLPFGGGDFLSKTLTVQCHPSHGWVVAGAGGETVVYGPPGG